MEVEGHTISEQILAEIRQHFGFVPPAFMLAYETPHILQNLWSQTRITYLDNPLPSWFKEQLLMYLLSYSECSSSHLFRGSTLHLFGMAAQDRKTMLETLPPGECEIEEHLSVLRKQDHPLTVWPSVNSALAKSLFSCSLFLFLHPLRAERCRHEIYLLLGPVYYNHLIAFLSYVKSYHFWMVTHPELLYAAYMHTPELDGTDGKDSFAGICDALVSVSRQWEQCPDDALSALVAMGQALVQLSEETNTAWQDTSNLSPTLSIVAQRLVELICRVLRCVRVGMALIGPDEEKLHPLAITGLADAPQWWIDPAKPFLRDYFEPALIARIYAGEAILSHLTRTDGTHAMLVVPMLPGKQLLGILSMEYDHAEQIDMLQEIELAKVTASLALLVLERTQAQAHELALHVANSRMDEFLGIASHELRTPLTTIKAHVGLIERLLNKRKLVKTISLEEHVQVCERLTEILLSTDQQINRLNLLIQDLLDATRIQIKGLDLHLQRCDLAAIVRETIMEQCEVVPTRSIDLDLPAETSVLIVADRDRIRQVVANYLTNALKYSPADSPVEVHLQVEEQITRVLSM